MAEPIRVRRLTDQEGQKLQQVVRRGSTHSVGRRAMLLPASACGNRVPVIAQLAAADEDTVRDVIHRFNEIGLACLDPQWAGGRPRQLKADDEDLVIQTATTRPTKLGQPFTRWSPRELAAYLRKVPGRVIRIGREALRRLLARRGVTFQRTKSGQESPDPAPPGRRGWTVSSTSWTASRTGLSPSTSSARPESGPQTAAAGPNGPGPTDCRPRTTTPTASGTSPAATRWVTTGYGASTAARREPGTRRPYRSRSTPPGPTAHRST